MQDQIIGETKHMYTAGIIIYVIVGILGSLLFATFGFLDIRNSRKQEKDYHRWDNHRIRS